MKKKQTLLLIFTALLCCFLASCQALPYFLEIIPTDVGDDSTFPTTTMEATSISGSWTVTPHIEITPAPPTATALPPTNIPTSTPMLISAFLVQKDMPIYLTNFAHPSAGCNWTGVAGQIFDSDGGEIKDLTVILGNMHSAEEQLTAARTGLAEAYGPGGYEIQIAEKTFNSTNSVWVQVLDPSGNAVSEKFFFDTFDDCTRNLILINFIPDIGLQEPAQLGTPVLEQDADAYP